MRLLVSSMSAGGRALRVGPAVVAALRGGGWDVEVVVTTAGDDPASMVEPGADAVGALGGDGFLAAVAQGCHDRGAVLAPMPGGRGNDLCRALGVGADPLQRASGLAPLGSDRGAIGGSVRAIDGMWVRGDGANRLALGIVSLGLDARANLLANRSVLSNGPLAYAYGAFAALATHRPAPIRARVDGEERDLSGWIASVSNSGRFGGGIALVPGADMCDGVLEVCHVGPIPTRSALPVLARVVAGRGAHDPRIRVSSARLVEFLEPRGMTAMADGDVVATVPFTVEVASEVVRVLV
ncbi:diacylglycerol kinase [Schaalia georgiae]|nr:diacylglycerol kinase [Schaalia georgiae]